MEGGITEAPSVWSLGEAPELPPGSCSPDIPLGYRNDNEPCQAPRKAGCRREQETRLDNRVGRSNVIAAGPRAAFFLFGLDSGL